MRENGIERISLRRISETLGFADVRLPGVNLHDLRIERGADGQLTFASPKRRDSLGRFWPAYDLQPGVREQIEAELALGTGGRRSVMSERFRQTIDAITEQIAISSARAIHDAWVRRQLIDIGENLGNLSERVVSEAFVNDSVRDGQQQAEDLCRKLVNLAESARTLILRRGAA